MKKVFVLFAMFVLLCPVPSNALFLNGGFKQGDFSGWTIRTGNVRNDTGYGDINWTAAASPYGIWNSSSVMNGQTIDVDPYNGSYMARINDSRGGYHATQISQTDQITQQDIDDGATIFVNWGAMLVEPSNTHPPGDQPNFGINLSVNGTTVESFTANALAHNSDPTWSQAGNVGSSSLWYKHETWSADLSGYAIGDSVNLQMWVTDCGWSGHGGYAFLDGIGTVDPGGPDPVPEPVTMLLLGTGIVGLAGASRRKLLKKK